MGTKVSISLSDTDIAYLDERARVGDYPSRSAAVHAAIRVLRESELADAYAQAFGEWDDTDWDAVSADGVA